MQTSGIMKIVNIENVKKNACEVFKVGLLPSKMLVLFCFIESPE